MSGMGGMDEGEDLALGYGGVMVPGQVLHFLPLRTEPGPTITER
jgi:hypothetical protein